MDRATTAGAPRTILGAVVLGSTALAVSLGRGWGVAFGLASVVVVGRFLDGFFLGGRVVGELVVARDVVGVVEAEPVVVGVVVVGGGEVVIVDVGRNSDRIAFGDASPFGPVGGVVPVSVPKNHPSTLPGVGWRASAPSGL